MHTGDPTLASFFVMYCTLEDHTDDLEVREPDRGRVRGDLAKVCAVVLLGG